MIILFFFLIVCLEVTVFSSYNHARPLISIFLHVCFVLPVLPCVCMIVSFSGWGKTKRSKNVWSPPLHTYHYCFGYFVMFVFHCNLTFVKKKIGNVCALPARPHDLESRVASWWRWRRKGGEAVRVKGEGREGWWVVMVVARPFVILVYFNQAECLRSFGLWESDPECFDMTERWAGESRGKRRGSGRLATGDWAGMVGKGK